MRATEHATKLATSHTACAAASNSAHCVRDNTHSVRDSKHSVRDNAHSVHNSVQGAPNCARDRPVAVYCAVHGLGYCPWELFTNTVLGHCLKKKKIESKIWTPGNWGVTHNAYLN